MILALALACCSSPPPDLMQACGAPTKPSQPPASGKRTIQNLAAWANQVQLAREATDKTLADCSNRHAALVAWIRR